ncbi:hypothetical protein [Paenibacillus durus]|uniref:Uncharacterized protein n=1 Tax=Paenibacillus durus TaxID=44251 RepID=A0A089IR78_PAEDU|nr:hypothetical protein [Paenibacillus durus]AIQ11539.1 hypothetical protein PDUR_05945 [Paenibacillus durus]
MNQRERVLVKHAVSGRTLLSSTDGLTYAFDRAGGLTRLTICGVSTDKGSEVLTLKAELNVFRFEEPEGGPVIKHWYYVGDNPVEYDEASGCLVVTAQSEIEYRPDQYWE